MRKNIWSIGMAIIATMGISTTVSAQTIKEGKWSMTIVTKVAGMAEEMSEAMKEMEKMSPEEKAMMQQMMGGMNIAAGEDGQGLSMTMTQCVSADNPVPDMNPDKDCTETHSVNGSTVTFEVTCPDSHSTGEVTYNDETMQGTIASQSKEGDVTMEISGAYEGPC
jgi:hypothetical protein